MSFSGLTTEVKKLCEKCNKIFEEEQNESDFSDRISNDSKEDDYVPPTPSLQKKECEKKDIYSNGR